MDFEQDIVARDELNIGIIAIVSGTASAFRPGHSWIDAVRRIRRHVDEVNDKN
jgi:hypothetical protein